MDTDGPHRNGSAGDHMTCQFCGPTSDDNSWDHMRWLFWDLNVMQFVGITYGCQSFGPHVMAILGTTCMAILGTTCHDSSGQNM